MPFSFIVADYSGFLLAAVVAPGGCRRVRSLALLAIQKSVAQFISMIPPTMISAASIAMNMPQIQPQTIG